MAEKYLVEGYEFETIEEANQAKTELDAVKYMSMKTSGAAPEVVLKVYRKIVDNNLFKTEIGLDYLRALEEYLVINNMFDVGSSIDAKQAAEAAFEEKKQEAVEEEKMEEPVILTEALKAEKAEKPSKEKKKKEKKEKVKKERKKKEKPIKEEKEEGSSKGYKKLFMVSVFVNVLLAIIVGLMMYIASTSSNINIINYETKLQDKYSSWADELSQKETNLRDKESGLRQREKNVEAREKAIEELEKIMGSEKKEN